MAYDNNFYTQYENYLQEETVRRAHDSVFEMFHTIAGRAGPYGVVDLGCGHSQEYRRHGLYQEYIGFDVNHKDPKFRLDYRSPELLSAIRERRAGLHELSREERRPRALAYGLEVFISLFSSEITARSQENTALYESLFGEGFQHALVSGFYYVGNSEELILETGDVVSWQTIEPIENCKSKVYDEIRVTLPVPSLMFGDNVIEVWRILSKKCS